ncbi:MAG: polysaccharide biosynthesis tyrosine autokinase [Actinomycetota bacterium]
MQQPTWAPASTDGTFLDLRDYGRVMARRWKLIAACVAVAIGLAVVWTISQTPIYTATAEILVKPPIATSTLGSAVQPFNIENERQIVDSLPVASLAIRNVNVNSDARGLLQHVDVTVPKDADVLQIHFQHPDPVIAQQGAQAFATAYFEYSTQRAQDEIDARAQAVSDSIRALKGPGNAAGRAQLQAELSQIQSTPIDAGEVLVDAVPPTSPTSPNLLLNLALAAILGAFVGLIAAFIRERMDDRLRGRSDLEATIGAPVMTMIPEIPSWRDREKAHLVTLEAPRSPAAEAYRTLRTSILVAAAEQGHKTLMVVSAMAGEGKTTTAANLAVVLAQADKRVVLISADLRRPRLHEFFGLSSSERGLSEVLEGDRKAWESLRSGKVDNLWIMSSGRVSDQPTELLQSEAMRELLADQREVVDFIIIDCPPVLAVADALVVAPMADAILYVANEQSTPRGAVIAARAQLDQVGARLLGAVLNDVEGKGTGYAYYGQYTYEKPATANGSASTWDRLRKKSPSA